MVSHHPAKFGDHRQYDSGNIMLLVAEEEDSGCSLQSAITVYIQFGLFVRTVKF